ncbi:Cdc50 [Tubulinosema ratisbonensis]|uniref:Cdc50 n=1 Tax=Tubulinosema ratisbonensis TaxID=291195 RepID=A0A437ALY3_9MICR|nr:Cdc50 [Tubulinosema ratisbonensis]
MRILDLIEKEKKEILERRKQGRFKTSTGLYRNIFVLLLGITNLTLGLILLLTYAGINQVNIPYSKGTTQSVLNINKAGEYKMYVEIRNFNQNFLNYSKSISTKQLKGEAIFDISKCAPLERNGEKVYYPCGLIANSFLQDKFTILGKDISTQNISWSSEIKNIKSTNYNLNEIEAPPLWQPYTSLPNLENNERFANWINLAPFNSFRKLYGKVYLEKGKYDFVVESDYPYGNKQIIFTESSWAGVKNYFLAITSIFCGIFMISGFFVLLLVNHAI